MFEISHILTTEAFYHLKEEWDELLQKSNSNNLFLTWDWLFNWWKLYQKDKKLNIVLVRENGALKAIGPLFKSTSKRLGLRKMQLLGSIGVGSDYLDFILYQNRECELLEEILRFLDRQRNSWDLIELSDIPEQSITSSYLHKQQFFVRKNSQHSICPYLQLPSRAQDLYTSLSKKMRSQINRNRRKFERDYNGTFVVFKQKERLDEAIRDLIRLNEERFKQKNIASPFSNPLFNSFHREIIPIFFDKGMLRLCFLIAANNPIASIYIFTYNSKYYHYQAGFDHAWNKISPGTLLLDYAIRLAIEEDMREFDFLRGNEEYKFKWTKSARRNLRIMLFNSSSKSKVAYRIMQSEILLRSIVKRLGLSTKSRIILKAFSGRFFYSL